MVPKYQHVVQNQFEHMEELFNTRAQGVSWDLIKVYSADSLSKVTAIQHRICNRPKQTLSYLEDSYFKF